MFDLELSYIAIELEIHLDGHEGTAELNVVVRKSQTGEWLEATVPYWRGPREHLPQLLEKIEEVLIEAETYLSPF